MRHYRLSVHQVMPFALVFVALILCATWAATLLASPQGGVIQANTPVDLSPQERDTGPKLRRKVLIVGLDGLRPDTLRDAQTPRIDKLIAAGSVSYSATNNWTKERPYNGHSASNWASLFTGVTPTVHGIDKNGDGKHFIDDDGDNPEAGEKVKTLFALAKQHDSSIVTVVINNWPGIGMKPGTILDHSGTVIDHHYNTELKSDDSDTRDTDIVAASVDAISGKGRFDGVDPDLMFVHISQIDSAGHAYTYGATEYREAIERVDTHVGTLVDAVQGRPAYDREDWLIILVSDHGGPSKAKSHGDNGDPEVRTIPIVISGRAALQGDKLLDASIYSIAPTALQHLGVELKPLKLRAEPIGLTKR